jgi:hypothetical protein
MFRVGQKVVCVIDKDGGRDDVYGGGHSAGLRSGDIYVVTRAPNEGGFMSVAGIYGSWCRTRFRPVVERKTDISIFKAMLTPKREDVRAHS